MLVLVSTELKRRTMCKNLKFSRFLNLYTKVSNSSFEIEFMQKLIFRDSNKGLLAKNSKLEEKLEKDKINYKSRVSKYFIYLIYSLISLKEKLDCWLTKNWKKSFEHC